MILEPLTQEGAIGVLKLREKNRAGMRTNQPVNEEDQDSWFYHATSRNAPSRWWQISADEVAVIGTSDTKIETHVVGYCGIEKIDWIARTGEMSLLLDGSDDEWRDVFDLLLNKAFDELNLKEVHAEVFHCNPDLSRWNNVQQVFNAFCTTLRMRKYWKGILYDADYISWRLPV